MSLKMRKRVPADLVLVILVTLVCIPFVLIPPLNETAIRVVLGLPLVLFLPGYALIAALFPRKDDLDSIERIALSFGLSIAVVPLLGLALNYTPFGIRLSPVLTVLSVFTISLAVVAYVRRGPLTEDDRFFVDFPGAFASLKESVTAAETKIDKILSVILIIAIVLAIAMVVYVIVTPKQGEKFTEFYILGPGGNASGYPTELKVGEAGEVIIGVVNHEYDTTTYQLEMKLAGERISEERIALLHNETWERLFTFQALKAGEDQKLDFLLYKIPFNTTVTGEPLPGEEYRSLHLWVDVNGQ